MQNLNNFTNLKFNLNKDELHIVYYATENFLYRITRDTISEKFERTNININQLSNQIKALRTSRNKLEQLNTLYSITKKNLYNTLFYKIKNIDKYKIITTSNYPLNTLQWSTIYNSSQITINPGIKFIPKTAAPKKIDMLSVTESGDSLKMAPSEHKMLSKTFHNGIHLIPKPDDITTNKNKIKKQLERAKYFHFAGHGYTNLNYPENSGLILYGTPPGLSQESILTLHEIEQLNLTGLELAFLNSCSSGFGSNYSGQLQTNAAAAFLKAGAKQIIVSLNPILDKESEEFTKNFYQELKKNKNNSFDKIFYQTSRNDKNMQISNPYIFIKG